MDNFYHTCPPKMADGRHMTDYRPHTQLEEQIKYVNGITRDDEARLFYQGNAEKLMDREWEYLRKSRSCWINECVHKYPVSMYPPWFSEELHAYNTLADPKHPKFQCAPYGDYRMQVSQSNAQCQKKPEVKPEPQPSKQ